MTGFMCCSTTVIYRANCLQLGYIDLTDPGPEYTFRDIVASTSFLWPGEPNNSAIIGLKFMLTMI